MALINLNSQSCEKRLMTEANAIKRLILFFIALIYVPESHKLLPGPNMKIMNVVNSVFSL